MRMTKDNIKNFFSKIVLGQYQTTTNAKGLLTIQQTERNKIRAEALYVLKDVLNEWIADNDLQDDLRAYITEKGIVLGVYNEQLDQEICFELSASIPALAENGEPYLPREQEQDYLRIVAQKNEEKAKKEQAKKEKIARDAKLRAEYKAKKENK